MLPFYHFYFPSEQSVRFLFSEIISRHVEITNDMRDEKTVRTKKPDTIAWIEDKILFVR